MCAAAGVQEVREENISTPRGIGGTRILVPFPGSSNPFKAGALVPHLVRRCWVLSTNGEAYKFGMVSRAVQERFLDFVPAAYVVMGPPQ